MQVCADTIVGNQMIRGISGGQRKRVTTGEMTVGPMKTLLMVHSAPQPAAGFAFSYTLMNLDMKVYHAAMHACLTVNSLALYSIHCFFELISHASDAESCLGMVLAFAG